MKSAWVVLTLCLLALAGCNGEELKKEVAAKNQIIAAQEAEIKTLKDDMAAREADLKNQFEQRLQKQAVQNKQRVDALQSRIADLTKKKDADRKNRQASPPAKTSKSAQSKGKAKR